MTIRECEADVVPLWRNMSGLSPPRRTEVADGGAVAVRSPDVREHGRTRGPVRHNGLTRANDMDHIMLLLGRSVWWNAQLGTPLNMSASQQKQIRIYFNHPTRRSQRYSSGAQLGQDLPPEVLTKWCAISGCFV